MEFIISHYVIFLVIAIVLLLGLFGYIMDRRKYEEYRDEIINEGKASNTIQAEPDIKAVASVVPVQQDIPTVKDVTSK